MRLMIWSTRIEILQVTQILNAEQKAGRLWKCKAHGMPSTDVEAPRNPKLETNLLPSVVVFEADDVVFDAEAHLRFDKHEVIVAVVLNAMHVADVDEACVAFGDADLVVILRKDPGAANHDPVFFSVLVFLEGEARSGVDDDSFYAVAWLIEIFFPAPPRAIVCVEKHVDTELWMQESDSARRYV